MSNSIIDDERVYQEAQRGKFDYFTTFISECDRDKNQTNNNDIFNLSRYHMLIVFSLHSKEY